MVEIVLIFDVKRKDVAKSWNDSILKTYNRREKLLNMDITFETITRLLMRLAQQQVAPEFRVFERKYPFTFCLMMVDKGTSSD